MSQPEPKELKEEPDATQATVYSVPQAASTVRSAADSTYQDLKDKLAKAEATIATLRDEATSGPRQRKAASSEEGASAPRPELAQAQRQSTEGVPVQIVALLCLISFLLAYFFF